MIYKEGLKNIQVDPELATAYESFIEAASDLWEGGGLEHGSHTVSAFVDVALEQGYIPEQVEKLLSKKGYRLVIERDEQRKAVYFVPNDESG